MWNVFMMRIITLITVEMISGPSCLVWCLHTPGMNTAAWPPPDHSPDTRDWWLSSHSHISWLRCSREYRNKISKYLTSNPQSAPLALHFLCTLVKIWREKIYLIPITTESTTSSSLTIILHFYITTYRCQMRFREDVKKEKIHTSYFPK